MVVVVYIEFHPDPILRQLSICLSVFNGFAIVQQGLRAETTTRQQ